jgi:hypothetical protein
MNNGQIYNLNQETFPFDDITLTNPQGLQGGAYFSKIKLKNEPITLQTTKCKTKNGLVKTEKKIYCDLMFDKDDETITDFIEKLEETIKNLIYDKKDVWFHSEMDMDTIEYHWQQVLRSYKGNNALLRCFIKKPKGRLNTEPTIQIYDEDESVLNLDDITKEKSLMTLLELSGLKFTAQSFTLEFNLVQVMIIKERTFRNKCLIKVSDPARNTNSKDIQPKEVDDVKDDIQDKVKDDIQDAVNDADKDDIQDAVKDDKDEDVLDDIQDDMRDEKVEVLDDIQDNVNKTPEVESEKEDFVQEISPITIGKNIKLEVEETEEKNEEIDDKEFETQSLDASDNLEEFNPEELIINGNTLEENDELSEINLVVPEDGDIVKLKKPNEVYMEIYREVKRRAKDAKKKAIEAYLEAKRIKSLYLLDEIESSDDENDLLELTKSY